jgi:cell division protein FtsB
MTEKIIEMTKEIALNAIENLKKENMELSAKNQQLQTYVNRLIDDADKHEASCIESYDALTKINEDLKKQVYDLKQLPQGRVLEDVES